MDIAQKTFVLTGATGGIGAAIAVSLDQAGARIILVGRNAEGLAQVVGMLAGQDHQVVEADLTTAQGRQAVVNACGGSVDGLINNAGYNVFGMFADLSESQLRAMVELNVLAPMLLCQALLPALQKSSGTIVNVGSGFGSIGFAGYCGYSASKFALRGFSESLRRELSDTGIEVLYLAPRAVDTAMNRQEVVSMNAELGNKVDSPQYVAQQLLLQLQSGQARRYLGWPERFFVKLNSVFPALVDFALAKQLPVIRKWAVASAFRSG
jgi:short-subunit dehydrogenase